MIPTRWIRSVMLLFRVFVILAIALACSLALPTTARSEDEEEIGAWEETTYRIVGGTWITTDEDDQVIVGIAFAFESNVPGGWLNVTGPNGFGTTIWGPVDRHPGASMTRSIDWCNRTDGCAGAGSGIYTAADWSNTIVSTFEIDLANRFGVITLVPAKNPTLTEVSVSWQAPMETQSFLVTVSPSSRRRCWRDPCHTAVAVLPGTARSIAFQDLHLKRGIEYAVDVYGFSTDIASDEPFTPPFNVTSDSFVFNPGSSCADYIVLDSRGSDQEMGLNQPSSTFVKEFRERHPDKRVAIVPNPYPAKGRFSVVAAPLKISILGAYHDSVVEGKKWLSAEIADFASTCPKAKLILTGYSQGAHVTADVYQNGSRKNVIAVVLFGDPKFNRSDPVSQGGQRGLNGGLGTRPRFAANTVKYVRSYCNLNDPICQGVKGLTAARFTPHKPQNYSNWARAAAKYFS